MKGRDVLRKAGWDTHGLPVELEVEKLLGLDGKEQIEQYGVEPFIEECKKSVWKYKTEWERMSERVGFWADMDTHITDNNIESVWWSLKKIHEKGCSTKATGSADRLRCSTALSSQRGGAGLQGRRGRICVCQVQGQGRAGNLFRVRPRLTLPSNVAIAPRQQYVKVEAGDEMYIMAAAWWNRCWAPKPAW